MSELSQKLLTRYGARDFLGVSLSKLDQEIRSGRLRVLRIGRSVRIDPSDLICYIHNIARAEHQIEGWNTHESRA